MRSQHAAVEGEEVEADFTPISAEHAWLAEMRAASRDPITLARDLELPDEWVRENLSPDRAFPLFAPRPYVARIERGNPRDPLLRQIWPARQELEPAAGYTIDPVGDTASLAEPGIIRKYPGRALAVLAGACAIHCRYCFRRHFPYGDMPRALAAWRAVWHRLQTDETSEPIEELILSGGDPLVLRDDWLTNCLADLQSWPALRRLRIHTRLPIVIPQRVTDELIGALTQGTWQALVVVHVNHPRELDSDVARALRRMHQAGLMLLNQSVLLRGINDDVETLVDLSRALLDMGVLPYYLHQLDAVAGAAHFAVPTSQGESLIRAMQARLPGYAVPRFVRDAGHGPSKEWLA